MANKNFLTISSKECLSAYKEVLSNSNRKLQSAKVLALDKDYGSAISLLIISNEELIKSLILFLDSQGFEFRSIKGVNGLFRNHRLRYLLAMLFSIIANFATDIINVLNEVRNNHQLLRDAIGNKKAIREKLQSYLIGKFSEIEEEIVFFSKFDNTRQKGLYSDLPGLENLSEADYLLFYRKMERLRYTITYLIEGMQLEDTVEDIESLKGQFKKNEWYQKIANLIHSISDRDVDPYQNFKEAIREFGFEISKSDDFTEDIKHNL